MKVRKISFLLIGALLASQYQFNNIIYAASPEEQCFTELAKAAKKNPAFSGLDLSTVKKISGKNGELESDPFSVKTYADFLDTFSKPVPYYQSELKYYPNKMNNVATKHRYTPKIHKANRTNSGVIIYNNGSKTSIDHWMSKTGSSAAADIKDYFSGQKSASALDATHNRQKIDGYYLNSRYVTFGRESDLTFSFPSRAANPADDGYYPSGRPVMDMREYVMYTQHLKGGAMGDDLLSCEIIKMVPQSPYELKDYDYTGDSIRWENYGGTKMSASNAKTKVVGGGKFRKAEIDYTITSRTDTGKQLLRFYVLSINYDNSNSFLNTFRTVEMFNEAMRDAKNASQNFLEMRRAFYAKVLASGLGIGQDTSVYNSGDVTADYSHYNVARDGNITMKLNGVVTYYATDQQTADKVCSDIGESEGENYFKGEWIGNLNTPTAAGWNYSNLAIRQWAGSSAVTLCGTNGMDCVNKKVQYYNKIRCTSR